MRIISPLSSSPELKRILNESGVRIVILVEGKDDCDLLREWFREERADIEFFDCGGITPLIGLLREWLTVGTLQGAYGITDRDFRSDEEVEASYAETSHQFILRRYALENYLLETKPLWEVLKECDPDIINDLPNEQAMATQLLERCRRLKSIMAANWVFDEKNKSQVRATGVTAKLEYFPVGHFLDRQLVIAQAAKLLQCSEVEAEELMFPKEELIEQALSQLETAHRVTDGKRLLHWIQKEQFNKGEAYFRRRLTREAKTHSLPTDIVHIVRERIIAQNRT